MTLILFCKKPAPGVGKQRLAQSLGLEAAYLIACRLHDCAMAQLCRWPGPKVVATADAGDVDWYRETFPVVDRVLAQPDGNLGERINVVDRLLRDEGHREQIIIGSDTPEQTPQMLEAAAAGLSGVDVYLAPAVDGGVSLMANRAPWPGLESLPWSTERLGQTLAQCCAAAGLVVGWGAPCADVDLVADLKRLKRTLTLDSRPEQRALHQLLEELI